MASFQKEITISGAVFSANGIAIYVVFLTQRQSNSGVKMVLYFDLCGWISYPFQAREQMGYYEW
jgi:hypothetical protein